MAASVFVHNQVNCAKKISGKIDELKKNLDRHKATIQNRMGAAEVMVDHAGKKLASWKSSTRNDIDKAALKEARPELWEEFPKQSTVRTFRIV
jgi:hypothetical protein